jgi:colicin import membrane protein
MAAEAEVMPPLEEVSTDIVAAVAEKPQIALLDAAKYNAFFQRIKAETETLAPDTTTAKGRDEIRAMAAKVVKAKAGIDKARLGLTAQWRDQTKQVNDAGKRIEAELAALADDVRKPLTEWEDAEKKRKDRCRTAIDQIKADSIVTIDDTAAAVRARGGRIFGLAFDPDEFAGFLEEAADAKAHAVAALKTAMARLVQEEANKAELEKLRIEVAEREARDLAEREEREAQEQQAAALKAEADRLEQIQKEAAEKAQRDAEALAQSERERERAAEAERAAQAEIDRLAAERAAEAARIEDERAAQAKREADQAHRTAVKTAAKEALLACGADETTARRIVLAIIAGEVPHVTLEF